MNLKHIFVLITLFLTQLNATFSYASLFNRCKPPQSNDCRIKDATVVSSSVQLKWKDLTIVIQKLPENSWYKIEKNSADEYQLNIYPNIGKHYLLGSHDFGLVLSIKRTDAKSKGSKESQCIHFKGSEDLRSEKYSIRNYDVEITHRVNYFYQGEPNSNPNPYTKEIKEILNSIFQNIKVGYCDY